MKQIELLKRLIESPGIYVDEAQREQAKKNLFLKMKRRDVKIKKKTQLNLELKKQDGTTINYR